MTLMKLAMAVLSCSVVTISASAADLERARDLFVSQFSGTLYKPGRCGENTETLIRLAIREGIDLEGASLIAVENKGNSNFGLVAARLARGQGGGERPGRANWSYHAFLVVEGHVLDFDFDSRPRILPLASYIREMFLPPSGERFKEYEASIYRVRRVEAGRSFNVSRSELLEIPETISLFDLLQR